MFQKLYKTLKHVAKHRLWLTRKDGYLFCTLCNEFTNEYLKEHHAAVGFKG